MNSLIKTIEDLSLNAWPSHQIQIYDGWLLRFSYFYTHRTNCVEQIGASTLPLEEKVPYCEGHIPPGERPAFSRSLPLRGACLSTAFWMKTITRWNTWHRHTILHWTAVTSFP